MEGSAVRLASLLGLASIGLFGLAVPAGAAGLAGSASTSPVDYSCSLAGYGQGLAPLTVPATLSARSTGVTVTVNLVTQPVQLPAATASALPQLSHLGIAGTAPASGMSGTAVKLSGQSSYLGAAAGGMTQLPAMTATGTVTQAGSGPAAVEIPPTLALTPVGPASSAPQAPLTCTTSSATTVQVTAAAGTTAGAPGTPGAPAGSGRAYTCTVTVGTSATTASRVPMSLTAAEPATVGTPDMLMLSAPASALGSAFPASATPVSASALAGLGGTGSVPLTGLADTGNGMFRLTGPWMPQKAGMVRFFAPRRFAARLREQTAVMVSVACTAATATTTTTQVMVQAAATMADSASPSAPAAAAGAPNTGGGGSLRPGSDLPLAAGGAAAVLAGLGIALYTLRRRRGVTG